MHRQDALMPDLPSQRRDGAATLAWVEDEYLFACFACRRVVSTRRCSPEQVALGARLYGVNILELGGVLL